MTDIDKQPLGRPLRGANVQYADGRIVIAEPLDVERILADLERLDDRERNAFLCVLAHNLTVEIRALLFDRPVSEQNLGRAYQINESLHQLTGCMNPNHHRSAAGDAELVRAIIESSYQYGLDRAIGRAVATAARRLIANAKEHSEAIE
jgi:hypothetical protein